MDPRYLRILEQVTADPQITLAGLDLLPAGERERLVAASAGPQAPAPAALPELLARQAARTPGATALAVPGVRDLSYAQLTDRVDRLAGLLARHGAGPERVVALALGRGPDFPLAALAVHRAGAAYLPLDPAHPAERVRRLLAETAPVLVLTDTPGDGPQGLADAGVPVLALHRPDGTDITAGTDAGTARTPPSPCAPAAAPRPGRLCHPHLRLHRHPQGSAEHSRRNRRPGPDPGRRLALTGDDRVLQLGSPTFDISLAELCMAFGSGATLVTPPPGPLAGEALARVLTEQRITCVLLSPSLLATVPEGDYPWLRTLVVGAEPCPPALQARWSTGGRAFHNAYGPTEATVAATVSAALRPDGTAADGRPGRRQPRLSAGRPAAPGPGRGRRRALPGRPRTGPGLSAPARRHRAALCRRPVRPARQPDVPHRRPGPP
ncbi:AMP-binding protein [Streptacidiphilus sp. 4-A2]|nr:AMP-binding protein [Streptacidiphilus sp. 4-A2]